MDHDPPQTGLHRRLRKRCTAVKAAEIQSKRLVRQYKDFNGVEPGSKIAKRSRDRRGIEAPRDGYLMTRQLAMPNVKSVAGSRTRSGRDDHFDRTEWIDIETVKPCCGQSGEDGV